MIYDSLRLPMIDEWHAGHGKLYTFTGHVTYAFKHAINWHSRAGIPGGGLAMGMSCTMNQMVSLNRRFICSTDRGTLHVCMAGAHGLLVGDHSAHGAHQGWSGLDDTEDSCLLLLTADLIDIDGPDVHLFDSDDWLEVFDTHQQQVADDRRDAADNAAINIDSSQNDIGH